MDQNTESIDALQIVPAKSPGLSIFASSPKETVAFASELAKVLSPVIESQGMYSLIQGKKHVKAEGWLTLGAMLGILPKETVVLELEDGSYTAHVDLVNTKGMIVGGASALCGKEEKRWANAERYARRSMAVTRATVKAYRIAFSWIIQLAGYNPTPAEEIPPPPDKYNHASQEDKDWLKANLADTAVSKDKWSDFSKSFHNKDKTDIAFETAVAKFVHGD